MLGRLVIAVAVSALVAGACSESSEQAVDTSATSTSIPSTSTSGDVVAPPTSRARSTTTTAPPTTTTAHPATTCEAVSDAEVPTFEIAARDNVFDPGCVELTTDQGINVVNRGAVVHNFTLQHLAGDGATTEIIDFGSFEPGENTATEAFGNQGPGAGTYRLYCKIHEGQNMEAFLRVS